VGAMTLVGVLIPAAADERSLPTCSGVSEFHACCMLHRWDLAACCPLGLAGECCANVSPSRVRVVVVVVVIVVGVVGVVELPLTRDQCVCMTR